MNVYLAFKEKLLASTNSATSFWGLLTRLFLSTNLPQQTVEEIAAGSRPTTSHRRPCWSSICLTFFSIIFCRFVSGRRPDDEGRKFICWKNWEQVQLNLREICFKTVGPIRSSQMIRSTECGRNRLLPAILFFFWDVCLAQYWTLPYLYWQKQLREWPGKPLVIFLTNIFLFYFACHFNLLKWTSVLASHLPPVHCDVKFTRDTILNFWHKTIRKWIDEFEKACRFVTRTGGYWLVFVVGICALDKLESRRVS